MLNPWDPDINLVRDPRWGRNQETPGQVLHRFSPARLPIFCLPLAVPQALRQGWRGEGASAKRQSRRRPGECPFLTGEYAMSWIRGMQYGIPGARHYNPTTLKVRTSTVPPGPQIKLPRPGCLA